jgi:hypothetical protein
MNSTLLFKSQSRAIRLFLVSLLAMSALFVSALTILSPLDRYYAWVLSPLIIILSLCWHKFRMSGFSAEVLAPLAVAGNRDCRISLAGHDHRRWLGLQRSEQYIPFPIFEIENNRVTKEA